MALAFILCPPPYPPKIKNQPARPQTAYLVAQRRLGRQPEEDSIALMARPSTGAPKVRPPAPRSSRSLWGPLRPLLPVPGGVMSGAGRAGCAGAGVLESW